MAVSSPRARAVARAAAIGARHPLPRPGATTHRDGEAPARGAAPPARKPMAAARRLTVFQRRIELGLSATALELVFEAPKVVSEGAVRGDRFAGSTTITIDLAALAHRLSDQPDASTARRVAALAGDDPRVRLRARQIAFDEARRLARATLLQPEIDLSVRSHGPVVHFALDVEALIRVVDSTPRRNP